MTNFEKNGTTLLLSCNVINTEKMLKVCRFVRKADDMAVHVTDGLGGERYAYFGGGFDQGECGLAIENPEELDKGLWQCFVKLAMKVENKKGKMETVYEDFGSIVDAGDRAQTLRSKKFPFIESL